MVSCFTCLITCNSAFSLDPGQPHGITSDGTLTTSVSVSPDYRVMNGAISGSNQFHSFSTIAVHAGESVEIVDPGISNTMFRATGGDYSWFNGLFTTASDNFYAINPNGIRFGADPGLPTGLSTAPPSGLGFINSTSDITLDSTGLSTATGETISLIGKNIAIENGSSLTAVQGEIKIVAVNSPGLVSLSGSGVDVSSITNLGDITLSDSNLIVTGSGAGSIYIRANDLVVVNGGIFAKNLMNAPDGGEISIEARGNISF